MHLKFSSMLAVCIWLELELVRGSGEPFTEFKNRIMDSNGEHKESIWNPSAKTIKENLSNTSCVFIKGFKRGSSAYPEQIRSTSMITSTSNVSNVMSSFLFIDSSIMAPSTLNTSDSSDDLNYPDTFVNDPFANDYSSNSRRSSCSSRSSRSSRSRYSSCSSNDLSDDSDDSSNDLYGSYTCFQKNETEKILLTYGECTASEIGNIVKKAEEITDKFVDEVGNTGVILDIIGKMLLYKLYRVEVRRMGKLKELEEIEKIEKEEISNRLAEKENSAVNNPIVDPDYKSLSDEEEAEDDLFPDKYIIEPKKGQKWINISYYALKAVLKNRKLKGLDILEEILVISELIKTKKGQVDVARIYRDICTNEEELSNIDPEKILHWLDCVDPVLFKFTSISKRPETETSKDMKKSIVKLVQNVLAKSKYDVSEESSKEEILADLDILSNISLLFDGLLNNIASLTSYTDWWEDTVTILHDGLSMDGDIYVHIQYNDIDERTILTDNLLNFIINAETFEEISKCLTKADDPADSSDERGH